MDPSEWFRDQLQSGLEGFVAAVQLVPEERRSATPPQPLGEWPATRHLFHVLFYERHATLPALRWWLGGPTPARPSPTEEDAWDSAGGIEHLLAELRAARAEQASLLDNVQHSTWDESRKTVWGRVTLRWIMTKTLQHTHVHTHNVLSLALFWDMAAEEAAGRGL